MQCKEITKHFKNRRSLLQVLGVLLVPLHPMMETQTTTTKENLKVNEVWGEQSKDIDKD